MTSPVLLCAIAHDHRARDVVRTSQRLARLGGFAPLYVHVVHAPRATSYAYGGYMGELSPTVPLAADELDGLQGAGLRRGARLLRELGVPDGQGLVTAGDPATELLRLALRPGRRDLEGGRAARHRRDARGTPPARAGARPRAAGRRAPRRHRGRAAAARVGCSAGAT